MSADNSPKRWNSKVVLADSPGSNTPKKSNTTMKPPLLVVGPFVVGVMSTLIRNCYTLFTSHGPTKVTDFVAHFADGYARLIQVFGDFKPTMMAHCLT